MPNIVYLILDTKKNRTKVLILKNLISTTKNINVHIVIAKSDQNLSNGKIIWRIFVSSETKATIHYDKKTNRTLNYGCTIKKIPTNSLSKQSIKAKSKQIIKHSLFWDANKMANRHATAAIYICISFFLTPINISARVYDEFYSDDSEMRYTREYSLKQGALRGMIVKPSRQYNLQSVEMFFGIPYAAPPVGSFRFMPPGKE